MNSRSSLITSSKKTLNTLPFRKSSILVSVTLIFFLLLSSLGNTSADTIQQDPPDKDGDGLSDALEKTLGTNNDSYYGDEDGDGLYDFEEYLGTYGNGGTINPTYHYNDATTTGDVLDIYRVFNLTANKTGGYLRDEVYTASDGGFTNMLLWNVTFEDTHTGGSQSGTVTYTNNILVNCSFEGNRAGGSQSGTVTYTDNILIGVSFSGDHAGGSSSGVVTYHNNTMKNVVFSTEDTGAGGSNTGNVTYSNNTLIGVKFTAPFVFTGISKYTGGSKSGFVTYSGNILTDVLFGNENAGGSETKAVIYSENIFTNVKFSGSNAGKSRDSTTTYTGNIIVSDNQDTDNDGLGDIWESIYQNTAGVNPRSGATMSDLALDTDMDDLDIEGEENAGTSPASNDTDGDGLPDGWEVTYMSVDGIDPLDATMLDLTLDTDVDGLNLTEETKAGTNPTLNDTDGDGLLDGWEYRYRNATGVDPTDTADNTELGFDADKDGLNLIEEFKANTDPDKNDTDGDRLPDAWEATYMSIFGIDPSIVTTLDLASDADNDSLTLIQETKAGTNPKSNDTDGDGLPDAWEVTYMSVDGVDPLVPATPEELASDADGDDLTLLVEARANKNPTTADNDSMPKPMDTTNTTTGADTMNTTTPSTNNTGNLPNEASEESSFAFLVVLTIFTSFSVALVVYRMRRRML